MLSRDCGKKVLFLSRCSGFSVLAKVRDLPLQISHLSVTLPDLGFCAAVVVDGFLGLINGFKRSQRFQFRHRNWGPMAFASAVLHRFVGPFSNFPWNLIEKSCGIWLHVKHCPIDKHALFSISAYEFRRRNKNIFLLYPFSKREAEQPWYER